MKSETRRLLFNKYTILSFVLLFLLLFLSYGIDSGVLHSVLHFNSADWPYTLSEYLHIITSFESYAQLGFRFVQMIAPVFPAIVIIPFLNELKTLPMVYTRKQSYKNAVLPKIVKCLLAGSLSLFLADVCYLLIGWLWLGMPANPGHAELFSEILGKNFYEQHMFWFFVIQDFLRFFVFPLVYGLFGISIAFLTSKKHLCVLIPVAYYTILSLIFACLNSAFSGFDFFYFSPSYTLMSTARPYINGFLIIAPLLPVLLFSLAVIIREFVKKHTRGDVLAAS